jgi:hypothetical protein
LRDGEFGCVVPLWSDTELAGIAALLERETAAGQMAQALSNLMGTDGHTKYCAWAQENFGAKCVGSCVLARQALAAAEGSKA